MDTSTVIVSPGFNLSFSFTEMEMILPAGIVSFALSTNETLILFCSAHDTISSLLMEDKDGTSTSSPSNGVQMTTLISADLFTFVPASLSMEMNVPGVTSSFISYEYVTEVKLLSVNHALTSFSFLSVKSGSSNSLSGSAPLDNVIFSFESDLKTSPFFML